MLSHVIRAQSYDDSGKLATVGEYTIVRRKRRKWCISIITCWYRIMMKRCPVISA